ALSKAPNVGTPVYPIASAAVNNGDFPWQIPDDPALLADDYRMLITRNGVSPPLYGTSYADFTIVDRAHVFYVNDDTVEAGDWCTAPGNDANDGITPATPKASIAAVLYDYVLRPGDLIKVDHGHYILTTNAVLDASDYGYTIEGYHDVSY